MDQTPATSTALTTSATRVVQPPSDCTHLRVAIVHVKPQGAFDDNFEDFASKVYRKIHAGGQRINGLGDQVYNLLALEDDAKDPKLMTAVIADIKTLLLPRSGHDSSVQALCRSPSTTVIGIIDKRGRTKSQTRNIQAEMRKFGNRKLGAATYCTTRKTLEHLLEENRSKLWCFQVGILWRVNGM
jgi:hypothetical protein